MESYYIIIATSIILILSHFYNRFSSKTNIPSVLLLIITGVILQPLLSLRSVNQDSLFPILEILGIIGLIMIVLEASLDLKLTRDRWPIIWKSGLTAIISLGLSILALTIIFKIFYPGIPVLSAVLYAIPLSIMSSAVVIPSVVSLPEHRKEFMIYESTISDILGIMVFYFVLEHGGGNEAFSIIAFDISKNIFLTVVLSLVLGYILILAFQRITSDTKLFLLLATLLLLYSTGKLFHLSSLLVILVFGLMLENRQLFFGGRLKKLMDEEQLHGLVGEFKSLTRETAFLIRTFFFVVFGLTIELITLANGKVIIIALIFLIITYGVRWALISLFVGKDNAPLVFIAPRGLISILLFFAIPEAHRFGGFESGVLLFTILATTIIMSIAMVRYRHTKERDHKKAVLDTIEKL